MQFIQNLINSMDAPWFIYVYLLQRTSSSSSKTCTLYGVRMYIVLQRQHIVVRGINISQHVQYSLLYGQDIDCIEQYIVVRLSTALHDTTQHLGSIASCPWTNVYVPRTTPNKACIHTHDTITNAHAHIKCSHSPLHHHCTTDNKDDAEGDVEPIIDSHDTTRSSIYMTIHLTRQYI